MLNKIIVEKDKEPEHIGLTDFEYAFYTTVLIIKVQCELIQKEKLRELAVKLTATLRQNVSIDWTIKENLKPKL